ncbi:biotin transporter BioY [Paracoccus fistulariae]|uniref:Biotin transporter n=1 Tax=Paracoccus fistulariae TaxID=658446 RepID=A0ABY7SJ99_9RHOB|nr:biotin transporter BioY [Paracoccus fistulariae]MDB6180688.1 biotin transporter BioY [Paracoccus fistulariae]WCR07080.1 biotin transporter BioY [Paracoccus fistulariae]
MQLDTRIASGVSPRNIGLTLGAVALLTLAAKTQVPFWPVPMTLQSLAVLVLAVVMGPRLALAAILTYMAAGAAGLPVFAGTPAMGIGLAYMAGPTGGFLVGFVLATIVTGVLGQGRGMIGRALAMIAGTALIYAAGLAWLANFVPSSDLLAVGLMPFVPGDIVKIALGVMLVEGVNRLRSTRG